jgi:MoxR-like ATPase
MTASGTTDEVKGQLDQFRADFETLRSEVGKVIVGLAEIVDDTLTALIAGGHVLLEGVPGLGKTLLVRTLADALSLKFQRIQFTPDLMPADLIGTNVMLETPEGTRKFEFQRGPIFANLLLADEINRATPKTQSALLEAMQERSVTVAGTTHRLAPPFFVLATQNPLEMEGTYPLPEAQLDRFFFKLLVQYSGRDELREILNRTTTNQKIDIRPILNTERILQHQALVKRVVIAPHVQDYAIRLVLATHPQGIFSIPMTNQFLRFGASPRAAQAITLASKVQALLDGRFHVSFKDVKTAVLPAMRHRIILNFEAEAEGITTDMVLEKVLAETPTAMQEEFVGAKR